MSVRRGTWAQLAGPTALMAVCGALSGACPDGTAEPTSTVTVYAASSLTEPFTELAGLFEFASPNLDVELVFAGSQVLRMQIVHGAPADVFASADRAHISALIEEGVVVDASPFAGNRLVVLVPVDGVARFDELDLVDRIVIGAPQVPVGRYAEQLLLRAEARFGSAFVDRVRARIVSKESNARLVRAKVALGEADAAVVYQTDAVDRIDGPPRFRRVLVPDDINVAATYWIGRVAGARDPVSADSAERWIRFVRSPVGRQVLLRHGFEVEDR